MRYVSDGSVSTVATVFDVVTVILVLVSASVYIYMLLLSMLPLFTIETWHDVPTLDNKVYPYYRDPNTRAGGIEEQGGKMYEI